MNPKTTRGSVLFVLTNHGHLGDDGDVKKEPTGFHLSEAADAWKLLTDAGLRVELASATGGNVPMDPSSADLHNAVNKAFLADPGVTAQLANTPAVASLDLADYRAIYFPGGHGTMWDLPDNRDVQRAVRTMYESGRPVAAVCHGPAALVNVKLRNGSWLVEGKNVSVFTDEEEIATGKQHAMPFSLAGLLVERGAVHHKAANFAAAVSVDGVLVTGQNPASARGVAEAVLNLIVKKTNGGMHQ